MTLADVFEGFADWCVDTSPLYERLARGIAADEDLLDVASAVPAGKSPTHLLLAGVHALLLADDYHDVPGGESLARFYPTVVDDAVPIDAALVENGDADLDGEDPFPPFRAFALARTEEFRAMFDRRRTQTNAVRRCVALLPAFEFVSRRLDREPFALVEVGPSAGLNLRWDSYRYDFGDFRTCGPDSPVTIESEIRGDPAPPLPVSSFPPVASRVGVDLHPLDPSDPADARWLKALVWPEHTERHRLLDDACEVARRDPPEVLEADATERLPKIVEQFDDGTPVVVLDTHVRYQFTDGGDEAYKAAIREAAAGRELHWLSGNEGVEGEGAIWLDHGRVIDGELQTERLLAYQQHGQWVRWES